MSLNTLKKAAAIAIEHGGWVTLDKLRKDVLIQYEQRRAKERHRKKLTSETRMTVLIAQLDQERRSRLVLLRAYHDLLGSLHKLALVDKHLSSELERHVATFSVPARVEAVDS